MFILLRAYFFTIKFNCFIVLFKMLNGSYGNRRKRKILINDITKNSKLLNNNNVNNLIIFYF